MGDGHGLGPRLSDADGGLREALGETHEPAPVFGGQPRRDLVDDRLDDGGGRLANLERRLVRRSRRDLVVDGDQRETAAGVRDHTGKDPMGVGNTGIDDHDGARSHVRQAPDNLSDGGRASLGLVGVEDEITGKGSAHRFGVRVEGFKDQAGLSDPPQSDHAGNAMRLRYPFAQVGTQFRKTFILDTVGPMVLGTVGPVEPGAKGADGSGLGLLLYPDSDGGVAIDPCGDLIGIAKVDLIIVHGHAGATESLPNTGFPSLDTLLRARMDGKHHVVAAGLED